MRFIIFCSPNGDQIGINADMVQVVRKPIDGENGNTIIVMENMNVAVEEEFEKVIKYI